MQSVTEQVRSPHAGEYLTIQQLADSLGLDVKTVQNKMNQGIFQRGVHWFRPLGTHPRFKWSAIVLWLEEKDHPGNVDGVGTGANQDVGIPMSRGYRLGTGKRYETTAYVRAREKAITNTQVKEKSEVIEERGLGLRSRTV